MRSVLQIRLARRLESMLKFLVFDDAKPATHWPIRNAYLLGSDQNAMRSTITLEHGVIQCEKREPGVAAFAMQYPVGECGEMTLQTCLLPERDEPYILSLELARHRLMVLYNKFEEWGMFEISQEHVTMKRTERARKLFVDALCHQDDPVRADRLARESLAASIDGSEELALAHAHLLLERRKQTGSLPRHIFGAGVHPAQNHPHLRGGLAANFDFIYLPMPWKFLTPQEGGYRWDQLDDWARWAQQHHVPICSGPLISFDPANLPDWMFIWEHDYETVRDLVYEHIERVVKRYKHVVGVWNVVSGLHVNSHFVFTFDQIIDLTRMATILVKKLDPSSRVAVEIREPFGEYYSQNQRSIPPMMYADLLLQGGINFDTFALKLSMGQAVSGQYTRDLMQLSNLMDQFAPLGKPVTVLLGAPSSMVSEEMITSPSLDQPVDANCGFWRKNWSPSVQGHWLDAMLHMALSKPYVDAVIWSQVMDHPEIELPLAGMVTENLQVKSSFKRYMQFRRQLLTTAPAEPA